MYKKVLILLAAAIVVGGVIFFSARLATRDARQSETMSQQFVEQHVTYAQMFRFYGNKTYNDLIDNNLNDPIIRVYYDYDSDLEDSLGEGEMLLYPGDQTGHYIDKLNEYLTELGGEIEGFDGGDTPVTLEDIIKKRDKIQNIISAMSEDEIEAVFGPRLDEEE